MQEAILWLGQASLTTVREEPLMTGPAMTRLFPQMKQAYPDTRCYFAALKPASRKGRVWPMAFPGRRPCTPQERRMALDACAGDEKPLHAHSASGSGELRWLEPGPRRGGSDFAERTLGVRYTYDFPI